MDRVFIQNLVWSHRGAWWKIKKRTASQWFTFICTLEFSLYCGKWVSCTNALAAAFVKLLSRWKGLLSQILHCHCNYLSENLCQWLFTPWWSPFQCTTQMSSNLRQITPLGLHVFCVFGHRKANIKRAVMRWNWTEMTRFLNCMYIHLLRFVQQDEKNPKSLLKCIKLSGSKRYISSSKSSSFGFYSSIFVCAASILNYLANSMWTGLVLLWFSALLLIEADTVFVVAYFLLFFQGINLSFTQFLFEWAKMCSKYTSFKI